MACNTFTKRGTLLHSRTLDVRDKSGMAARLEQGQEHIKKGEPKLPFFVSIFCVYARCI